MSDYAAVRAGQAAAYPHLDPDTVEQQTHGILLKRWTDAKVEDILELCGGENRLRAVELWDLESVRFQRTTGARLHMWKRLLIAGGLLTRKIAAGIDCNPPDSFKPEDKMMRGEP